MILYILLGIWFVFMILAIIKLKKKDNREKFFNKIKSIPEKIDKFNERQQQREKEKLAAELKSLKDQKSILKQKAEIEKLKREIGPVNNNMPGIFKTFATETKPPIKTKKQKENEMPGIFKALSSKNTNNIFRGL